MTGDKDTRVKICTKCGRLVMPSVLVCPTCGGIIFEAVDLGGADE